MGSNVSQCVHQRNSIENFQIVMNQNSVFANLKMDEYVDLKISKKQQISKDVYLVRFNFPKVDMYSGLSTQINEDLIMRDYTPFTKNDVKGYMECIVKIYRKYSHPDYPNGGLFTSYFENNIEVGDFIPATGPRGKFKYCSRGTCSIDSGINNTKFINFKYLGLICSGTGLAPLLQLAQHIAADKGDKTQVYMLNANSTEDDVLLIDILDQLKNNDKMTINVTVSRPTNKWKGLKGRISKELIEKTLPQNVNKKEVFVCICGSDAIQQTSKKALKELGYEDSQYFSF